MSARHASSEAPPAPVPSVTGRRLAVLCLDPVGAEIARRAILAGQRGAVEMQLDRDERERFMAAQWPRVKR